MGRRLNISQPAVIQTELRPLDESFWIDANGQLEQWYYQNTNVFAPDRQITPLILTPHLSAVDRDTNTSYTPTFQLDRWLVKEYKDGAWVTTTITSQDPTADYEIVDGIKLKVNKNNYDATHAINITCKATYQDPRDVGVLHNIEESVMLVTSVDATQAFPNIDIVEAATRTYNPLKDESPIFGFEGKADWDSVEAQGGTAITECKVDPLGTEQILPTNDEMMLNAAPTLNIHYGDIEKANQKFMYRQTANGEVSEIVGGVSAIDNIKGNTVAWNQAVLQNVSISQSQGNAVEDKWSSFDSNTTLTANGRELQILKSGGYGIARYGLRSGTIVSGHVYYIGVDIKTTASAGKISVSAYAVDNIIDIGRTQTETTGWQRVCLIKRCGTAANQEYRITDSRSSNFDTVYAKGFMLFDLTLMFGEGNEPETVADFETWLTNNVGLKDYYEYCSGKLVNFGGYGVKWNQLLKEFSDTNWVKTYNAVVVSYDNNTVEFTVAARYQGICTRDTCSFISGHKYYISCFAKSSSGILSLHISDNNGTTQMSISDNLALQFKQYQTVTTCSANSTSPFFVWDTKTSNWTDVSVKNLMLIDLTEMFGAGNEPTLEWCEKYFSKDYYPYCPALDTNILSVMTTKESGFNIWDEEWENGEVDSDGSIWTTPNSICSKNFIPCFSGVSYYFLNISNVCFYDANKTFIQRNAVPNGSGVLTSPSTAGYMKFDKRSTSTYNHDTCINVSDPERNGEYEPYHVQYKSPEMGIKTTGFNLLDVKAIKSNYITTVTINGDTVTFNGTYYADVKDDNLLRLPIGTELYFRCEIVSSDTQYVPNITVFYEDGTYSRATNGTSLVIAKKISHVNLYYAGGDTSTVVLRNICINISDPSKNGTYEPYWESKSDMSWITKIGIENFNIWDEEWEVGGYSTTNGEKIQLNTCIRSKNMICLVSSSVYFKSGWCEIYFYDSSKTFISSAETPTNQGGVVSTPANAKYMTFRCASGYGTTYNHDICINLSIPHFNGRYYPHGETAPYFPNGLCKAGSVFDEVKVEGGKIKGVVRFGKYVVTGNEPWLLSNTAEKRYTADCPFDTKNGKVLQQSINDRYAAFTGGAYAWTSCPDRAAGLYLQGSSPTSTTTHTFVVRDTSLADLATFKAAIKGLTFILELATPYEFEIDYPTKGQFMWYGVDGSNNEVPIDQLPIYSQATQPSGYGQGTSRININALYGENIAVILRVKRYPWSNTVLPPRVTKSVAWSIPPIDVITTCDKGSAVRATNINTNFVFGTIVNQQGDTISDEKKAENMRFDWYMVKYGTSGAVKTPYGSGLTKSIPASELENTTPSGGVMPSTNVYCEAFLLGAYEWDAQQGKYVRS